MPAPEPEKQNPALAAGQKNENQNNESAGIVSPVEDDNTAKTLANAKAHLALAGHPVHELADGSFLVVRPDWAAVRHCPDLRALVAFAKQVTA